MREPVLIAALQVYKVCRWVVAHAGRPLQRLQALFLCLLILSGVVMPPVSAYAANTSDTNTATPTEITPPPDTTTKMKQDYAGPLNTQDSIADVKIKSAQDLPGVPKPMGEALPSVGNEPKVQTGEIVDKRTANSTFTRNADGTVTEKRYMQPINFQKGNKWEKIDTTLIEDKNAGDAGTPFGRALGQVESWMSSANNFQVKDNGWQARFSPSDSDRGMVRVKQGDSQVGFVPVGAKSVAPVITTDDKGRQTVGYYDLWPGVNVEYVVTGGLLKENIILKDKNATNQVQFKVVGAELAANDQGGFAIKGAFGDKFTVTSLNLMLTGQGPVTDTSVFGQTYKDGTLTIQVNKPYLQNLSDSAFPAVIDPGVDTTSGITGGGDYKAIKSDGTVCTYTSSPQCKVYVGGLDSGGGVYKYWRSAYYAPYSSFANNNKRLVVAKLYMNMQGGAGWHGTTASRNIYAWRSTCNNAFNCIDSNTYGGGVNIATAGEIDLTALYGQAISAGDYGMWLMLQGEEASGWDSFKEFDPLYTYMSFTWADSPPAPPILSPSDFGQVFADPQVPIRLGHVDNPNNSTPLQYEVRVSTAPNGTGTNIDSGPMNAAQWTIPDGMLQDGSTYWVQARTIDNSGAGAGAWSVSVNFKIDLRTGKDKTQTYDNLGPVSVDLGTGNVTTSASSHSTAALGGSLGVSLDYNSPLRSRPGLSAQYWNNSTMSGTPNLQRIDQNIDFDWSAGTYSSGMNTDNFSAAWDGYFVAPATGSYTFGANNDDSFSVTVNNTSMYTSTGCQNTVCYGASSIALTAGQVVPIHATFVELTGYAYAKMWVKGPVTEGAIPSTWLRTSPRPMTQSQGLVGRYYFDDGTHNFATAPMFMERTDPWLNLRWDTGSPVANGPTDNFMIRWTGYFTAPVAGSYIFGAYSDDGVRIKIGSSGSETTVLDSWVDQGEANRYGSGYTLSAGQTVPITVDYFEHTGGAVMGLIVKGAVPEQVVPSAWLSPKAQVLPDGWQIGVDPDGDLSYDRAKIGQNSVVLTDSSGSTHEYTYTGGTNGGYKPPVNEDGQLVRNVDGTFTLLDTDDRTYVFNADGTLKNVTNPLDDLHPAALQYSYGSTAGGPAHITQITDGVDSGRWAKVFYSGATECGSTPSGYTAAPSNMLCAVQTNDGRTTYFYYDNYGSLRRIAQPGNAYTDYEYDSTTHKTLTTVRDVLANDAIAAGVRANDAAATTQLSYDVLGRVTSVKQPAPTASASRVEHTIEYLPGTLAYQNGIPSTGYFGATQQHVTGMTEPNGFAHRIEYDNLYRTTKDTDIANLSAVQAWDVNKDLLYSTTDATGLMTTTLYDDEDRATDSYGPAPSSYFGTDRKPTSTYVNTVPRTETHFDEGINGPAVAWYNSRLVTDNGTAKPLLYGAPKLHTTGILPSDPTEMGRNFTTNPAPITVDSGNDNIAFSATGKIVFPQTGTYTFKYWHDDGARLFIDDASLFPDADWWHLGETQIVSQASFTATAGKVYRFRLDFVNRNAQYQSEAWLAGPGITDMGGGLGTNHWGTYVRSDYSLTTSTKVYDNTLGNSTTTTNYGSNPELGLANSTSVDPTGLNLTTSMAYEAPGATGSYLRQTAKYLPGANTSVASTGTQYSYYAATDTKDDPCTTGTTEAYKQGGMLKLKTEPDPDGTGSQTPRTTETIYDDAGKVVATRYNSDSWTCTTYDSRERPTSTVIPAFGSAAARTITNNYAVGGNPLVVTTGDSQGWVTTTVDLLGRTTVYSDIHGDQTTTTYDSFGKVTQRVSPLGTESYVYDTYNRLTDQKLDTVIYAHVNYDSFSRVDNVTYPNAGQMRLQYARDALGNTSAYTYTLGNGTTNVSDTVTRSQSNQITTDTVASGSTSLAYGYSYDTAGRLTGATAGSHSYSYGFGTESSTCNSVAGNNLNAGKNSNRTTQTVDGVTTTYCYDQADRLKTSSNAAVTNVQYDAHGNTISLGSGTPTTLGYDSSDRNTVITEGTASTTYTRDVQGRITQRVVANSGSQTLTGPWVSGDVGSPAVAGSSTYASGVYTIKGAGYDVWGGSDEFQFDHQSLTGDGQIVARVTSQTNTDDWAKAGIVIKDSTTPGSKYVSVETTPANGVRMEYNYNTDISGGTYTFPNAWLKLVRSGNTITTYKSPDGTTWTQVGSTTMALQSTALIGLYVSSVNQSTLSTATFDNVTVTSNAATSVTSSYGFTSSADTPDFLRSGSTITEKYLPLFGGPLLTVIPAQTGNAQKRYGLPTLHGSTLLTTDAAGTNTSTGNGPANAYTYDPFGNKLPGSTLPANTDQTSFGYAGRYQKDTETNFTLTPIQMGARVYFSVLGRFAQVDPIDGGTPNSYVYVVDPVNGNDYSGKVGQYVSGGSLAFISDCRRHGIGACLKHIAIGGAVALGVVYAGPAVGIAAEAFGLKVASASVQAPLQKGIAGMNAAGVVQNTQRIASVTGTANYRIPDLLVRGSNTVLRIGEVKNVQYQSYTSQIQDFVLYSQQNNIPFTLYMNGGARMSQNLQGAIDDGMINLITY